MNKDNAKEFLPLVQALANGRTIQFYSSTTSKWCDASNFTFGLPPTDYRIKPERIKKKMWYKEGITAMYEENCYNVPNPEWIANGWKLVEVEFDVP